MTNNNLQNLSKDELLKLLLQSQSELSEAKEELENTRNELKDVYSDEMEQCLGSMEQGF